MPDLITILQIRRKMNGILNTSFRMTFKQRFIAPSFAARRCLLAISKLFQMIGYIVDAF